MASREFADYVIDLLRPLGAVRAKRMFGGFGLYLDDCMFALIADDTLYLKAEDSNRAAYAPQALSYVFPTTAPSLVPRHNEEKSCNRRRG